MTRSRHNSSGFALLEILLATVILVLVSIALTHFALYSSRLFLRNDARLVGTNFANNTLERVKSIPYAVLDFTPKEHFKRDSSCHCDAVDWLSLPKEVIHQDTSQYEARTCVTKIERPGGRTFCPDDPEDFGLKSVVIQVTWNADQSSQTTTVATLIKEPDERGTDPAIAGHFHIRVCEAVGSDFNASEASADEDRPCDLVKATVGVFNKHYHDFKICDEVQKGRFMDFEVSPTGNYTIHVEARSGYFPFRLENQRVGPGEVRKITAYLRSKDRFGSRWGGEVSLADHPVISKIVAQVSESTGCSPEGGAAPCGDYTEAIEIYNPTERSYSIGQGGNLSIAYYAGSRLHIEDFGDRPRPFPLMRSQPTVELKPYSFLLIAGVMNLGNPASNVWKAAPDAWYQAGLRHEDRISYHQSGGVRLLVNGVSVDAVRWEGTDGNSTAPAGQELGPWEGPPLPKGSLQPAVCTIP